jgi:hypothetical protein
MTEWTSTIDPTQRSTVTGLLQISPIRWADDGRVLVLDNRGFWIAVNINKSVPSWKEK